MNSGNPVLSENTFAPSATEDGAMTLQGTVFKTGVLLALLVVSGAWAWNASAASALFVAGGAIGGFIIALVLCFKQAWSPVLAPIYAVCEGLFLGAISAMYNAQFHGIVLQAILLTLGVTFAMLFLYQARILRATPKFVIGVFAATAGIGIVYLVDIVMGFFGHSIPMINQSGTVGICFSIFVVIIAALNLIMDFGTIEAGVQNGAPRYMEWYGGFAIMVTLVWLYLEILRLLAKMQSRR